MTKNSLVKRFGIDAGLILLWLLVQISLFSFVGVKTILEAEKYTNAARYLAETGTLPAPKYVFYSTLIGVIYFFNFIGLGYSGVTVFQMILNGIATLVLYKLTQKITNNYSVSRLTCFLFILFIPLQTWNVYLYTESIFISLVIFLSYTVLIFPPNNIKNFLLAFMIVILMIVTRPFGILFIIPLIIYTFLISKKFFRKIIFILSFFCIISFLLLINFAFKGGEDMDALKPFREEHVICFIPNKNPQKINVTSTSNPVYDIAYYVVNNPKHFLSLVGKRLYSFFNLTRPYYSTLHNIYLIIVIVPVYVLIGISFFRRKKLFQNSLFLFFLIVTLFYALAVTLQCDDYHSRFIMPLFFIFFILASISFFSLIEKGVNKD